MIFAFRVEAFEKAISYLRENTEDAYYLGDDAILLGINANAETLEGEDEKPEDWLYLDTATGEMLQGIPQPMKFEPYKPEGI